MFKAGLRTLTFAILLALSVSNTYAQELPSTTLLPKDTITLKKVADATPVPEKPKGPVIAIQAPENLNLSSTQVSPASKAIPIPVPEPKLNANFVFNLINAERAKLKLEPFEKDEKLCPIAKARAYEIPDEVATGTIHAGFYARNLPYFAIENAKYGGDERETVRWWMNSPIHRSTIVGDMKYSCVACSDNSCSQIFTSYTPKFYPSISTPLLSLDK